MTYDENVFKEKANRKARKIWIVFAVLLSANYGSDASGGLYPTTSYLIFLALCWLPLIFGEVLLRVKGWATELYRYDLVIGYGIFYTFVICTTASPIAFTYILPVTSLLVLYKNRKFMIGCGIANALIIVGAAVYRYMLGFNSASDMKNYQLQLSCIILCYICYVMSIRHLNESDGAMTDSIRADLHRVVTTVEQVKSSSNIILDGITVVRELASENKHNIVDTITTCITHSSRTSERMLSKYQETADNINTIEDVMENMMCDLGIGGFMGIEDIKPGMKIDLQLVGQEDVQYLGELIEQLPEGLLVSCQKKLTVNGAASCMLQVTAGNILYCWDKAAISPAPESGEHAFKITITTRPRINNRRKYPRMDLNNTCTIKFKNSDTEYAATMENISANGFAFLATDKIFTQSKNAEIIITIHDFALANHNELEGRIIRCSDDNGLYIVGCQMPEDNFYILEYVENNLNK